MTAAATEGKATASQMMEDLRKQGFDLSILSEYGDLNATLADALEKTIKQDPTPLDWQVVAVETPRTGHGYARCDVVYCRPDHGKVVRDYKYTQSVDKKYVPQRLRDYAEAGQRHHYLWQEEADTFIVTLVVANPFKVYEQPFVLDKDRQVEWLRSARVKWDLMEQMEAGTLPLFEADSHVTKYGRGDSSQCILYDWCLEYHRDPKALEVLGFVQIERKRSPVAERSEVEGETPLKVGQPCTTDNNSV